MLLRVWFGLKHMRTRNDLAEATGDGARGQADTGVVAIPVDVAH